MHVVYFQKFGHQSLNLRQVLPDKGDWRKMSQNGGAAEKIAAKITFWILHLSPCIQKHLLSQNTLSEFQTDNKDNL